MISLDDFEKTAQAICLENEACLAESRTDLKQVGLKEKTVARLYANAEFYFDIYLLRKYPQPLAVGITRDKIRTFLGSFLFINTCGLDRQP